MPTVYNPSGITVFGSSCSSKILSSLLLNYKKDYASAGRSTEMLTSSSVSRSVVAGRAYDHDAGSFVLTMIWFANRAVANSGIRLGASSMSSVTENDALPPLPSSKVIPIT